jgi:hypothetical protein
MDTSDFRCRGYSRELWPWRRHGVDGVAAIQRGICYRVIMGNEAPLMTYLRSVRTSINEAYPVTMRNTTSPRAYILTFNRTLQPPRPHPRRRHRQGGTSP